MKKYNLVTALNIAAGVIEPPPIKEAPEARRYKPSKEHTRPGLKGVITRAYEKVGRNDQCPCGSGQKFKKCCGRQL